MTGKQNNLSNLKMGIVYFSILLLGIACFTKIMYLVIFERALYQGTDSSCLDKTNPDWENNPLAKDPDCNCFVIENNRTPRRGDIYDDRGRVLASSIVVYDITLDGKTFNRSSQNKLYRNDSHKLELLINDLSNRFYKLFKHKFPNYNFQYYKNKISKSLRDSSNVIILRSNLQNENKWITTADIEIINKMPVLCESWNISGLNLTRHNVRLNPYGEMAKRAIGKEINGQWNGLEYEMNKELYGSDGTNKIVVVKNTNIPLNKSIDPIDGHHIHTTINLEIQNIVHNELLQMLKNYNADWGCAVVMETKTGEIKAISNLTLCDTSRKRYEEQTNYVLNYMLEPGSTFKLASLLAFLERTPNDTAKKYPILAHNFIIKNRAGTREYSFPKVDEPGLVEGLAYPKEVIQRSSNVGIASMIFDKYKNYRDYLNKIDSMYITTSFSTQLGKVKPPNIKRNATDFHSYYNTCFGTGFKMAPIQTLIYFNAVANDGKMIVPLFVKYISENNDTIAKFQAEVISDQICKPSTIKRAKEYLKSVVYGEYGTAKRFKNPNFTFAGKTGTRDIWDEKTHSYNRSKNCVSFCGYFPADNPRYTCIVYMYNVPKKSSIAVEVFANIAKRTLNISNFDALQKVDQAENKKIPRFNAISKYQLEVILSNLGIPGDYSKIKTPYVVSGLKSDYSNYIKAYNFKLKDPVIPNVVNMISSNAVYELNRAGYKVIIEGRGSVKEQYFNKSTNCVTLILGP